MAIAARGQALGVGGVAFLAELLLDPTIGRRDALLQRNRRLPAEVGLDLGVVTVAARHAARRVELVVPLQLDARDLLGDVHQLVDGHQFARSQIDRLVDLRIDDLADAFDAVVDVHERTRLRAVAPDLDRVVARCLGSDHLAADGGGSLLAAAPPRAVRPVDVVKPRNSRLDAEVLAEMTAHPLAEQLFPAVAIFRQPGIGVCLRQGRHMGIDLLVGVVDTRGRTEEEPLHSRFLRRQEHVGVGEHAEHAEGLVVLDEPHASHVGGQLVDVAGTAAHRAADAKVASIAIGRAGEVLRGRRHLIPVFNRLDVDRPHVAGAEIEQLLDEMATDESAAACHHHNPLVHLHSPSLIDDGSLAVALSSRTFTPMCQK